MKKEDKAGIYTTVIIHLAVLIVLLATTLEMGGRQSVMRLSRSSIMLISLSIIPKCKNKKRIRHIWQVGFRVGFCQHSTNLQRLT